MLYYASFIPGLQNFIAGLVRERLKDAVIHYLLDGAVVFETSLGYDRFNFFCFNNIFAVVNIMEHTPLEAHITAIAHGTVVPGCLSPESESVMAQNSKKIRTFKIFISRENHLVAVDEKLRLMAEKYIAKISGLTADRGKPDTEFWFLLRQEKRQEGEGRNFSLFMKRLSLRPSWEKSLHPGELPPPLAWILCRMGNLRYGDTVLDPFCGYGSIPQAALKHFHITKCIACDSDKKAAVYTAARFSNRRGRFVMHKTDFHSLPAMLPEKSVDAIITDPPWGHYRPDGSQQIPVAQLYEDMFMVFDILLKEGGRLVILGARSDEPPHPLSDSAAAQGRFTLQESIPILLSGKKAAIYRFRHV